MYPITTAFQLLNTMLCLLILMSVCVVMLYIFDISNLHNKTLSGKLISIFYFKIAVVSSVSITVRLLALRNNLRILSFFIRLLHTEMERLAGILMFLRNLLIFQIALLPLVLSLCSLGNTNTHPFNM